MISRLIRAAAALFMYFCVATFIAQLILLVYLGIAWKFDRNKGLQVLAILQDVDLYAKRREMENKQRKLLSEEVSYQQIVDGRAMKGHHLQLRELALKSGLDQLETAQRQLADEQKRYEQVKTAFNVELRTIQEDATATGMEDIRANLEALKSKNAKEILAKMLEDDEIDEVVTLLRGMTTSKSAKIISEFKSPKEVDDISKVLRLMREGAPVAELAADTQNKLNPTNTTNP